MGDCAVDRMLRFKPRVGSVQGLTRSPVIVVSWVGGTEGLVLFASRRWVIVRLSCGVFRFRCFLFVFFVDLVTGILEPDT